MPTRYRTAAHLAGHAPPVVQRLEAAIDHAEFAPQHARGALHFYAGRAIGAIMFEIDRGGGAIVLAHAVRRIEMADIGQIGGVSLVGKRRQTGVAPADFFRSEERRVGKEGRSRWSPYH